MEQDPSIEQFEHYPIADAIDHDILMHRDAHFGGLFSVMLDYYSQDGKGVQPEFSLERIERLAKLEKDTHQNLAAMFLTAQEMQKVADVRAIYKQLRSIYEVKNASNKLPQLIADLILTEDEGAEKEIEAVAAEKGVMVPLLIELLRNESLYDPLFPGYGQAPVAAARALGEIGDKRGIISLFESIGQGDFFSDDYILDALKHIGEPAKEFLLRVVAGRPLNEDNEKAAIALIAFKDDAQVSKACLELLKQEDIRKDPCLSTYLILVCEGLRDQGLREEFKGLETLFTKQQKLDMNTVEKSWAELQA